MRHYERDPLCETKPIFRGGKLEAGGDRQERTTDTVRNKAKGGRNGVSREGPASCGPSPERRTERAKQSHVPGRQAGGRRRQAGEDRRHRAKQSQRWEEWGISGESSVMWAVAGPWDRACETKPTEAVGSVCGVAYKETPCGVTTNSGRRVKQSPFAWRGPDAGQGNRKVPRIDTRSVSTGWQRQGLPRAKSNGAEGLGDGPTHSQVAIANPSAGSGGALRLTLPPGYHVTLRLPWDAGDGCLTGSGRGHRLCEVSTD